MFSILTPWRRCAAPKEAPLISRRAFRSLILLVLGVDVLLLVLHLVFTMWHLLGGKVLWVMFDLGAEENVPTWWASMLWMAVAMASYACHVKDARGASTPGSRLWLLLAAIFTFASMDEVATIHEEVGTFLQWEFQHRGWFQVYPEGAPDSPWIVFYAPFLVAFAVWFLWLARRTLVRHRRLGWLVAAALACQALAIGMDYYQGMPVEREEVIAQRIGWRASLLVDATVAVEETLENLGATCLLAAFASYAKADAAAPG